MHPKRHTLAALAARVRALKRRGKKIVMTNGCFDLLHAGHVRYLASARALGDALIVAVNTDAGIRRLKGATRPIVPLAQRLEVLAALSCVDYLVAFGTPTPRLLIETLAPDVLVKGGDWARDEIVGRASVERCGGRVARIPLVAGLSTTKIIARILASHSPQTPALPVDGTARFNPRAPARRARTPPS